MSIRRWEVEAPVAQVHCDWPIRHSQTVRVAGLLPWCGASPGRPLHGGSYSACRRYPAPTCLGPGLRHPCPTQNSRSTGGWNQSPAPKGQSRAGRRRRLRRSSSRIPVAPAPPAAPKHVGGQAWCWERSQASAHDTGRRGCYEIASGSAFSEGVCGRAARPGQHALLGCAAAIPRLLTRPPCVTEDFHSLLDDVQADQGADDVVRIG